MMNCNASLRWKFLTKMWVLSFLPVALFHGRLLSSAFMIPQRCQSPKNQAISTHQTHSNDDDEKRSSLPPHFYSVNQLHPPSVEFIDPETKCQVVLLGCFHGTESSSKDVERAMTSDTDAVVLELCPSRFSDLQRELLKIEQGETRQEQPWLLAYYQMIKKTISNRGLPTGLAAAVLGGFSGIQTALSGFTPGLEFTTALKQAQEYKCDIILADQDVDETLRRVGNLPQVALETAWSNDRLDRWRLHQDTLVRAVVGQKDENGNSASPLPQVTLPLALIRTPAAIQDLVRLTVPPSIFFWTFMYGIAAIAGIDVSANASAAYYETATMAEKIAHYLASAGILSLGYLGLALSAVSVILTERDEILTTGIKAACRRAGEGGRVVAVLGLLHVNGVAKRMLTVSSEHP